MANRIYSSDFQDVTVESIAKKLGIADADADTREIAVETLDLCDSAYHWGLEGLWPDQNFSSDRNWRDAYGESIFRLEFRLDEELASRDDGPILEMFRVAHARGLERFQVTEI